MTKQKFDRVLLAILGKTNSGKTWLLENKIIPLLPKPVFILDAEHEYNIPNAQVFYDFLEMHKYISREKVKKNSIFIFRPEALNSEDGSTLSQDIIMLFKFLSQIEIPLSFVIEEAGHFMTSKKINKHLSEMMFQGAHNGHSLIFVAQRPTQLHNNIFTQCLGVISFYQTGRGDINKLRDFDDEKAQGVNKLDYHNYEYVSLGFLPKEFPELKKELNL